MSTTYYLSISGGADVLLADSDGTILAYQAGSTEGPGGTYTLTPVFDTTLITLPTDVQVWYSNDGTNFAYSPAWITSRTGDTITVTVASSTTVTAKLYYSNGTVVTDENSAEVASVSTVIGGGTAPTLTASGNTGTAAETGAVLTVTASATGSPTPTITYVWKADETDDGSFGTTIAGATSASYTVDASYDGHDIRCEVTASNGVSPDDTAVIDWAKAANDWDTYEVARATGITLNGTSYVACSFNVTSTELDLIDLTREQTVGTPRLRDAAVGLTSSILSTAPYIAVWNITDSDWAVYDTPTLNQAPPAGSVDYTFIESRSGTADQASFLDIGDQVVYVILSSYTSGDISGWSDYS